MDRRPKSKEAPLRTLEVGAINTQLLSCPWLNVRAIDLNSKHEKIEQCDFFSLRPSGEYDVLVSSMVINCVPDAPSRGKMLQLSFQHLRPGGLFFLMLPLLCLHNSKYMTYVRFVEILKAVGFLVRETKESPKVAFFCLERPIESEGAMGKPSKSFPQQLVHSSDDPKKMKKRNSFSVVL
ncbi:hypothetical protein PINS_up013993 [Pythium insidiosum]|nr:hypothetical protein PINS_up013993 [Pythium insidiosum]